jgi:hypothetical protein
MCGVRGECRRLDAAHKGTKAACHSDNVADADEAKVVQVNTLKAHGVVVNESGL